MYSIKQLYRNLCYVLAAYLLATALQTTPIYSQEELQLKQLEMLDIVLVGTLHNGWYEEGIDLTNIVDTRPVFDIRVVPIPLDTSAQPSDAIELEPPHSVLFTVDIGMQGQNTEWLSEREYGVDYQAFQIRAGKTKLPAGLTQATSWIRTQDEPYQPALLFETTVLLLPYIFLDQPKTVRARGLLPLADLDLHYKPVVVSDPVSGFASLLLVRLEPNFGVGRVGLPKKNPPERPFDGKWANMRYRAHGLFTSILVADASQPDGYREEHVRDLFIEFRRQNGFVFDNHDLVHLNWHNVKYKGEELTEDKTLYLTVGLVPNTYEISDPVTARQGIVYSSREDEHPIVLRAGKDNAHFKRQLVASEENFFETLEGDLLELAGAYHFNRKAFELNRQSLESTGQIRDGYRIHVGLYAKGEDEQADQLLGETTINLDGLFDHRNMHHGMLDYSLPPLQVAKKDGTIQPSPYQIKANLIFRGYCLPR